MTIWLMKPMEMVLASLSFQLVVHGQNKKKHLGIFKKCPNALFVFDYHVWMKRNSNKDYEFWLNWFLSIYIKSLKWKEELTQHFIKIKIDIKYWF